MQLDYIFLSFKLSVKKAQKAGKLVMGIRSDFTGNCLGGGGVLPYKSDGGDHCTFWKKPLKGTQG